MRSLQDSPPVIRPVKRPRHFRFTDVLRSFRGEHTQYYRLPPAGTKQTLILDLDQTLIHSSNCPLHSQIEWFKSADPEFYIFKRHDLDDFLKFGCSQFEVFLFMHSNECYANPIVDVLMPWLNENHKLSQETWDGHHGLRKAIRISAMSPPSVHSSRAPCRSLAPVRRVEEHSHGNPSIAQRRDGPLARVHTIGPLRLVE
jgi:hypothetical protein